MKKTLNVRISEADSCETDYFQVRPCEAGSRKADSHEIESLKVILHDVDFHKAH